MIRSNALAQNGQGVGSRFSDLRCETVCFGLALLDSVTSVLVSGGGGGGSGGERGETLFSRLVAFIYGKAFP